MIQALSSEAGKAVTLSMSRVVWLAVSVGLIRITFRASTSPCSRDVD